MLRNVKPCVRLLVAKLAAVLGLASEQGKFQTENQGRQWSACRRGQAGGIPTADGQKKTTPTEADGAA